MPRILRTVLLMAGLVVAADRPAAAQEYCVACTGPDAIYRCVIDGARPGGSQPLQMLCVTSMAKSGGHATCSVTRGTVFQCNGPVKRVPWVAADAPGQAVPTGVPATPPAAPPPQSVEAPKPAAPASEEPPKTMVELAQRANEKTAEQLKKAGESVKEGAKSVGDSIGSATKKTWECMTSLFTRC